MSRVPTGWLLAFSMIGAVPGLSRAQSTDPLPPETRLVATSTAPAPTEQAFTISSAQDLVVTMTDLQVPAALASATVVVSQGSQIVGNATLAPPATTATVKIAKAQGDYVLRVFGAPNASYSVGTFTVCVAPQTSSTNCIQAASLAGNITAPSSAANPLVSTLSSSIKVMTAGTYTVTYADDQFPVLLQSPPNLALFQGSSIVSLGIASGTTLSLSPGTYTLLSLAEADATAKAGLYGIEITGPQGTAPLLNTTVAVGAMPAATQVDLASAQSLTLKVSDFAFPTPLASASALVTSGSAVLGTTTAGGSATSVSAPAGVLQVWRYAAVGSGAGTYEVDLSSASALLAQTAAGVSSATSFAYAFVSPSKLAAGAYQVTANDLQFPEDLAGLSFALAQNGTVVGQMGNAGTLPVTATAGPAVLLAAATPTSGSNGLFDINIQTAGNSPSLVYDQLQAVSPAGGLTTQPITLGVAGNFQVTLTDLALPAKFGTLALVGESKGTVIGKIYGGGTFPLAVTPGDYQFTVVAIPASGESYGMYGIQIVNAAPTVTLTASPTSLSAGQTTKLSWTSTNATSCAASGGSFTGSQPTGSGSTSVVVAATTTYTLSCTGPGGTASQSVTVSATAAVNASHSGGGALGGGFLTALLGVAAASRRRAASIVRQ